MYYKTDHHLTDRGSYILYSALINKMKKDFPDLNVTPKSEFKIYSKNLTRASARMEKGKKLFSPGKEYELLLIKDENLLKTEYDFFDYKKVDKITMKKLDGPANYKFYNPNGKHSLMIIGDSFQETLTPFFNTSFREVYKYRTNIEFKKFPTRRSEFDMKGWITLIEEYKPDTIILLRNTDAYDFSEMYPSKEVK